MVWSEKRVVTFGSPGLRYAPGRSAAQPRGMCQNVPECSISVKMQNEPISGDGAHIPL